MEAESTSGTSVNFYKLHGTKAQMTAIFKTVIHLSDVPNDI
jgi:hypothetical protein